MADVIVTLKVMPSGPDKDFEKMQKDIKEMVDAFVDEKHKGGEIRVEEEPIGFGLKALKFTFVYEESNGTTDSLEEDIQKHEDVESVETVDCRRALG